MDEISRVGDPIMDSLRQYVFLPISDAQSLVQAEYEEVDAERAAFGRFKERVAGIDTVPPAATAPPPNTVKCPSASRQVDRLRSAYRDTVMSVSHYDDVYGESLVTNAAAELSAAVATGFQRDGPLFTDLYKTTLIATISRAIARRETFCDILEAEQASLETAHDTLTDLVNPLDGPRIPACHTTEFEETLTDLAATRQETVRTRDPGGRVDGHDLCSYLYDGPEWTYPVLTAITRVRTAVEYGPDRDQRVVPVPTRE